MQRTSTIFTALMLILYFVFMYFFAFSKTVLSTEIVPGLTTGLVAGPCVIAIGVLMSFIYVYLANKADGQGS